MSDPEAPARLSWCKNEGRNKLGRIVVCPLRSAERKRRDRWLSNMLYPRWRQKISERLSYPIRAELLSRELEKHPELPHLELHFTSSPIASESEFRQMLEDRLPYVVLRVQFVRWDKRLSYGDQLQDYLRGKWTLDVFPCSVR
jgi:hypothetical protein